MNIIFITEESRCDIHVEDDRSLETFETILTVSTLRHTEDLLYVSLHFSLCVNFSLKVYCLDKLF